MFGLNLVGLVIWFDFKWVGYSKKEQRLKLKDNEIELEIDI